MPRTGVRRRVTAIAIAAAVAALLGGQVAQASGHGAKQRPGGMGPSRTYVVTPGDTLWSIATRVFPGQDPRSGVAAIEASNHLADPDITPGQALSIPATT